MIYITLELKDSQKQVKNKYHQQQIINSKIYKQLTQLN